MSGLYSIRMRAARGGPHEAGGTHISGAERIVAESDLSGAAQAMIERALTHSKGKSDFINITVDVISENEIEYVPMLAVREHPVPTVTDGHETARKLLMGGGISALAVERAFTVLEKLSHNMRGAVLLDCRTGVRLDGDDYRGIRVSRMDAAGGGADIRRSVHMSEALVLASKVSACPGILGELCWSDDPDYVIGYVSIGRTYHRISHMKAWGSPLGGRVFFCDGSRSTDGIRAYLEERPVLVKAGE